MLFKQLCFPQSRDFPSRKRRPNSRSPKKSTWTGRPTVSWRVNRTTIGRKIGSLSRGMHSTTWAVGPTCTTHTIENSKTLEAINNTHPWWTQWCQAYKTLQSVPQHVIITITPRVPCLCRLGKDPATWRMVSSNADFVHFLTFWMFSIYRWWALLSRISRAKPSE